MALDRFGRRIHYLRISLTDHCNLRCLYCMPEEMTFRPSAELMQDEEIIYFTRLFASIGFNKVRLTGGEPTVRENIISLVHGISHTAGIDSVTMTTNGMLLANLAKPLADAGLKRVNISLDTLDPQKFHDLTRYGDLDSVWKGIEAAQQAGLTPIKINAVIVAGHNDRDVLDLARLTLSQPWQVRFIEMMPFGGVTDLQQQQLVTTGEVQAIIESAFGPLDPKYAGGMDGEACIYRLPAARGNIGFISSISQPFCTDCTRARLTADGILRMCLLREYEIDLLSPLRSGASYEQLRQLILDAVWQKPWGHGLATGLVPHQRAMSEIGG